MDIKKFDILIESINSLTEHQLINLKVEIAKYEKNYSASENRLLEDAELCMLQEVFQTH